MCVIFLVVNHHISIWLPQTSGMVWTLQQHSMTCVCLRNSHSQLLLYGIWFEFLFSNWQIYKFLNATMWMCRLKWSNMVFNEIHSNAANKWILLCISVRPNRGSLNRHIDISMCTISEAARISHIVILSTKTGFWNRTFLSKELKISSKSAANAIVDSINRKPKSIEGKTILFGRYFIDLVSLISIFRELINQNLIPLKFEHFDVPSTRKGF